jgi:predicted GNAT family acetyltransferase
MLILQKETGNKGVFYIEQDGKKVAEMDYVFSSPGVMTILHTEVDDSLGGKGVGKELVGYAVEYAREHHIKIIPVCQFTKAVIARKKEWQDVLEFGN